MQFICKLQLKRIFFINTITNHDIGERGGAVFHTHPPSLYANIKGKMDLK